MDANRLVIRPKTLPPLHIFLTVAPPSRSDSRMFSKSLVSSSVSSSFSSSRMPFALSSSMPVVYSWKSMWLVCFICRFRTCRVKASLVNDWVSSCPISVR